VLARLRAKLDPVCAKLDGDAAARSACEATFKSAAKPSA
jgi:hypothetical protein